MYAVIDCIEHAILSLRVYLPAAFVILVLFLAVEIGVHSFLKGFYIFPNPASFSSLPMKRVIVWLDIPQNVDDDYTSLEGAALLAQNS